VCSKCYQIVGCYSYDICVLGETGSEVVSEDNGFNFCLWESVYETRYICSQVWPDISVSQFTVWLLLWSFSSRRSSPGLHLALVCGKWSWFVKKSNYYYYYTSLMASFRTTWVSWYQKSKMRWWGFDVLASAGPYPNCLHCCSQVTTPTPYH